MARSEHRAFSAALVGICWLVAACGGRAEQPEQATGTATLNESGGTGATGGGVDSPAAGGASANATGGAATGSATTDNAATGGAATRNTAAGGMSAAGTSGAGAPADCNAVRDELSATHDAATTCDPNAAVDECTASVVPPFGCLTPIYVNPANADAVARFAAAQQAYVDDRCALPLGGACAGTVRGRCDATGHCEGVPQGAGRNCKVNGVVYASGESNIADPTSCNTCTCEDGELACTATTGCDEPCPDGQVPGRACAECDEGAGVETPSGPEPLCVTVETGCFWPCSADCGARNLVCDGDLCVAAACP